MIRYTDRLSTTPVAFSDECNKLCSIFLNLGYPVNLVNLSINEFLHIDNLDTAKNASDYTLSVMNPLPFKNQQSTNSVKCRIGAPTLVSTLKLSSGASRLTNRRRPLLLAINAWFTNSNAICATQIMSDTQLKIYTNAPTTKIPGNRQAHRGARANKICLRGQAILHLKEMQIEV